MSQLNIQFLGDVRIFREDEEQTLPPSRKTRALLAYLAINPRSFSREHLCELLWEIPDDPRGSLRWSLSKLRRLVDDKSGQRIVANRTQVSFSPEGAAIDVVALEKFCAQDFSALETSALHSAADNFDGAFLGGLELADYYEFHTWSIGQRQKVASAQASIRHALIERYERDPQQRFGQAQKLVELAPWDETSHVHLIRALVDLGRRSEAQQQADLAARKLEDYGVEARPALRGALRSRKPANNPVAPPEPSRQATEKPLPLPASRGEALKFASAKIIGRDQEVGELISAFNEICETATARLVMFSGQGGIGKSTLLRTMKAMAREVDVCLLEADAFESEIIRPFALWNDAFRRNLAIETPTAMLSESPVAREQLFTALDEVIKQQCSARPTVVIFDDMQWCDESSAAALHYLLRMNKDRPFAVMIGARGVELKENTAMQQALRGLRGEDMVMDIALEPLAEEVTEVLISREVPQVDAARLAAESGGIPLLALELARAEAAGDSSSSLAELVHDRLSRLDDDAAQVVLWSSVLSPNINVRALQAIMGLSQERLEAALESAQAQNMLLQSERGFSFFHDLIARAVYDQISTARQQRMHHRVAEYLEIECALDRERASDMARHAEKSGDPALTARAMLSAGRLCLRYYANDDALNLSQSGLEFTQQLPDAERICLTLELSEVRVAAAPVKDWEDAAEHYVELAEEALDHGALPAARLGYHLASSLRWMHGEWGLARADSLQAERVSRGATDDEHILGMAETAKCLAMLERDLSQADAMTMEAQALASRKHISCPALAEASGILRYYEGKYAQAEEALLDARAQSKVQGDRIAEYQANEYLFMLNFERCDLDMAQRYCNALLKIGEKVREGSELPFAQALQALLSFALDRQPPALSDTLQALRAVDAKHRLSYVLNRLAVYLIDRREFRRAEDFAREALECSLLLDRPSEVTLAKVALAKAYASDHRTAKYEQAVADIRDLYNRGIAEWARQRARPLLTDSQEQMS